MKPAIELFIHKRCFFVIYHFCGIPNVRIKIPDVLIVLVAVFEVTGYTWKNGEKEFTITEQCFVPLDGGLMGILWSMSTDLMEKYNFCPFWILRHFCLFFWETKHPAINHPAIRNPAEFYKKT